MRAFAFGRRGLGACALAAMVAAMSVGAACVKSNKTAPSAAELETLKDHILPDLPADVAHKVDVNFEDKVHLVGWKAEPEIAAPGAHVNVSLYWRRTGDLDAGWKLFTHVTGESTKDAKGNLDWNGAIRQDKGGQGAAQLYGPSDWEKGKVIVETLDYTVPKDVNSPQLQFLVGVWKDTARLHINNADASDGDDRANVVKLQTGWKPSETPAVKTGARDVPRMIAPKLAAGTVMTIDGKLDEPAWQKAGNTGPFVDPGDGSAKPDHPVAASGKMTWDDVNLYVAITVADKDPTSPFKESDKDPHIWEKSSAVELMVQPGNLGDNKDYYELQVDVNGASFDTHWDDYNVPKDDAKQSFGHMDWSSGIKRAVSIDKGKSYTVEMAIPWASFVTPRVAAPPKSGDMWRIDLYSFKDGQKQALSWSPIMKEGNFHKATRFGLVTFRDPAATPLPSMSGSAPGGAAGNPMMAPGGMHMLPNRRPMGPPKTTP